jgi:hypothetical protein
MQPMKLQPLHDQLVSNGIVDPSTQVALPMAIADAYEELSKDLELDDEKTRLLFECCLVLIAHNFRSLRADAQGKQVALLMNNPGFEWRESAPEPEAENPEE